MRFSLRTLIMLLVTGTVASLAGLVVVAFSTLTHAETDASTRGDVQRAGGVLAQLICERSQSLTDTCRLLTGQPKFINLRGAAAPAIASSLRDWLPRIQADDAILTDVNGVVRGATNKSDRPGADMSAEHSIGRALDGSSTSEIVIRHSRPMLAVTV